MVACGVSTTPLFCCRTLGACRTSRAFIDRRINARFKGIKPRPRMFRFTHNLLLIYFERRKHSSRSEKPHSGLRGYSKEKANGFATRLSSMLFVSAASIKIFWLFPIKIKLYRESLHGFRDLISNCRSLSPYWCGILESTDLTFGKKAVSQHKTSVRTHKRKQSNPEKEFCGWELRRQTSDQQPHDPTCDGQRQYRLGNYF